MSPDEELRLIDEELERRSLLSSKESAYSESDNEELRAIDEELARRGMLPGGPGVSPEQELSVFDRIGQAARGAAKTYGGIMDIANMARQGYPTAMADLASNYEPVEKIEGRPLSEELPKTIDTLYGRSLEPTDTMGRFSQGIGEFGAPLPIPGAGGYINAAKSGIKGLSKYLGKEAAIASGASGATHLTPRISEEETIPGFLEDIAKAGVGAKLGHMAYGLEPGKILAKGASKFIEPNEEILRKAHKHKIDLPFNVGANSTSANFVANNFLKSMYVSKKYKEALKKSDASMVNAVKRSIDTLGEPNLKPTESSLAYREYVKEQEKVFKKEADKLYTGARESLGKNDKVIPKKTINALNSEPVEELLNTLSPSSSEKSVINRINEIKNKISGEGSISAADLERYKDSPKWIEALKAHRQQDVSVKELINLRKSLLNTLDYDPDVRGSGAFLSRLIKTLDEDIKTVSNKDFLSKYESANKFFKQEVGQRFRKSIAQSIMRNETPREAYDLLNSVDNIKMLEKVAGQEPKGKEIFDSLKKAKVRDIVGSAIHGELEDGSLRTAAFAKLFQKGEKRQEILETLLGKKEYNNLAEIAKVSEEFSRSGRELLNTSGTAHVLSDMNLAKNVASEVTKTLGYLTAGGSGGFYAAGIPGAALGTAAVGLAAPYVISRLVSNPKFVNQMRTYALARKSGNDKYANTIMKKIIPVVVKEINNQKHSYQQESGVK